MPPLDFTSLIPDRAPSQSGLPDLVPDPPKQEPDFLDLIPPSTTTKVARAMGRGYLEGFEGAPEALTPYAKEELARLAQQPGFIGQLAKVAPAVADAIRAPLAVGPGLFRGAQAGLNELLTDYGVGEQAARDIISVPESLIGMPGAFRTPEAPPPIARAPRMEPGFGPEPPRPTPLPPGPSTPGGAPAGPSIDLTARGPGPLEPYSPEQIAAAKQTLETPPAVPGEPLALAGPPARPERPAPSRPPEVISLPDLTPDPTPQPLPPAAQEPVTPPRQAVRPEPGMRISGITDDGREVTGEVVWVPPAGTHAVVKDADGAHQVVKSNTATAAPISRKPSPAAEQPGIGMPGVAAQPTGAPAQPFGGPWTRVKTSTGEDATNLQGEPLFQNANGLRATMDGDVPFTERFKEHPEKGLLPRDVVNRKGQFLTTEEAGRAAAPTRQKGDKEKPAKPPETEQQPAALDIKPREQPEPGEEITAEQLQPGDVIKIRGNDMEIERVKTRPDGWIDIKLKGLETPQLAGKDFPIEIVLPAPMDESESETTRKPLESESKPSAASPESTPAEKPSTEPTRTEHPGLRIKSLETGKETVIQPVGTVPPAQSETAAAPAIPETSEPPKPTQNITENIPEPLVTHVTKKGKTLTGVIRRDLDKDSAKAIDPYTFRKDGGWFIRQKPTKSEPKEEPVSTPEQAATQAGDTAPPDPPQPEPEPSDPAVAEAADLAQGKGPEPVTALPDPRNVEKRRERLELRVSEITDAENFLDEGTEEGQRIQGMLWNGWSPVEISETPGITKSPREIRAIDAYLDQEALDRSDWMEESGEPLPSWRPKERYSGLQGALRYGDEGEGPEGVPGTGAVEPDGQAPAGEEPGGAPDAGQPAGGQTTRPRRQRGTGGSSGDRGSGVRDADRVPDTGSGAEPGTTERPPNRWDALAEELTKGDDFVIQPGDLAEDRGRMQKARDNVKAIELAKQLTTDHFAANREQQRTLVKYVGWGGLKNAFRDGNGNFGQGMEKIGEQIEKLLTPEELRTAERSTQYAHYTAEHVIRSMWDAVRGMGFDGGSVFEPGMGIGHFRGLMPPDLAAKSQYRGVEMDHLTTSIAKLLYPNSGVRQADFTRMPLPTDSFDLVIGNPPFSDAVVSTDPRYAARRFMLHDYFFAKSLDAVRPGGLLAFVTSAGTMNKMDPKAREYLAAKGQFLGGVRLPSSAFRENAGTDVTTDILFFKRRPEGARPIEQISEDEFLWTKSQPRTLPDFDGNPMTDNVSRYFADHPEMVLGEEGFFDKLYQGRYAVHQRPDTDLASDLRVAVSRLPTDVMDPPLTPEDKLKIDFDAAEKKDGSYYVSDGKLMQYSRGAGREVPGRQPGVKGGMPAADRAKVMRLVPIRNALRDVLRHDLADDAEQSAKARDDLNKSYDAFVKQFGPINKAEISYRRPTIGQQETARQEARENARYAGERWYEGDFDAEPYYRRNAPNQEIARARQDAREAADREGKPFNEGSFDPDDIPDVVIDKRPNIDPFMQDPESYRLRSIEDYNDSTGTAQKREIFHRNPMTKYVEPELKSANDGLLWSLNALGRLDIPAIATKMGRTEAEITNDLGELVFELPEAPGTWQTRDEYLSGDVKTKLAQVTVAARDDPRFERNRIALDGAQPEPLHPGQITLVIGMPWMPINLIKDFAKDHLELGNVAISYSPAISRWSVEKQATRSRYETDTAVGLPKWSTPRRDAYELLQDALNRDPPKIYDRGGRDEPPVLNEEETIAAQDKMQQIQREFFDQDMRSGWAISEPERGGRIADLYNEKLNREVLRQYNGDYLTTPGVSAEWRWRPHQTRVVSRIILEGNTYMAHAVGAGKTSAMIGAGMEMKRLGLVRKPMYVVPNHMLGQFSKEFYEQYPGARIAIADDKQFHTDRRRQFMSNVALEDLDGVIITHSSFGKLPMSPEFTDLMIRQEVDEITEAMKQAKGDRFTVGRLQKMKEKLTQRLSRSTEGKDQTFNFEEMGVDFLFVDEAHMFRKLPFVTLHGDVKGVSPDGSAMARDLHMKIRYLDTLNPGRSVVLASGTPVTNTMGELYSLSRYLQPNAMKERGVETFDGWTQTFANTKTEMEQAPDGSYKAQTRLAQFVNMPELYKMVGSVMDIVTSQQLAQYVTRPKLKNGERAFHNVEATPEQIAYSRLLGARMKAIKERRGKPEPGDDIILSVINDGRHAAIDPRFIGDAQSDVKSKLNDMLGNVLRIWKDTADTQFYDPATDYSKPSFRGPATQMIFANLGINKRQPTGFSTYDWIKEYLRRNGVPASEVAFIKDFKTSVARQGLFNDMNAGKVRILVGSTQKMGTGVNAQRRLIAVHNEDPLWFPADDEQRNGRILRQGNHNPEIEIHDYATKGSYDSTMWQMMGRKAGFIEQFFRGDPNLRDMEDLGEASMYEQASAMTTSDPRILELTQMKHDLKRSILRREAHRSNQWSLRNKYEAHQKSATYHDWRAERIREDMAKRQDISGKNFTAKADGETYTKRDDFNKALNDAYMKYANGVEKRGEKFIGEIGGFSIRIYRTMLNDMLVDLIFSGDRDVTLSLNDPSASASGILRGLEADERRQISLAEDERAAAKAIWPNLGQPFTGNEDIDRLDKAVKALEKALKEEGEEKKPAPEPAPDTQPDDWVNPDG